MFLFLIYAWKQQSKFLTCENLLGNKPHSDIQHLTICTKGRSTTFTLPWRLGSKTDSWPQLCLFFYCFFKHRETCSVVLQITQSHIHFQFKNSPVCARVCSVAHSDHLPRVSKQWAARMPLKMYGRYFYLLKKKNLFTDILSVDVYRSVDPHTVPFIPSRFQTVCRACLDGRIYGWEENGRVPIAADWP